MGTRPYKISENCRQIARRTGFDVTNPDRRYPVEKTTIKNIHKRTQADPRRDALLRDRFGRDRSKVRGRGND